MEQPEVEQFGSFSDLHQIEAYFFVIHRVNKEKTQID